MFDEPGDHPEERVSAPSPAFEPLAARMRPRDLDEYLGQDEILGPGKVLRRFTYHHPVITQEAVRAPPAGAEPGAP